MYSLIEESLKTNHVAVSFILDIAYEDMPLYKKGMVELDFIEAILKDGYNKVQGYNGRYEDANGNKLILTDKEFSITRPMPYMCIDHLIAETTYHFFDRLDMLKVKEITNIGLFYMTAFTLNDNNIPIDKLFNLGIVTPKELMQTSKFSASFDSFFDNGLVSQALYSIPKRDKDDPHALCMETSFTTLDAISLPIKVTVFNGALRDVHGKVEKVFDMCLTTEFKDSLLIQDTLRRAEADGE